MAKYKVLKEFVLNGILKKANTIIELDYQQGHLKSIQENIELVGVSSSTPPVEPAPSAPTEVPPVNIPKEASPVSIEETPKIETPVKTSNDPMDNFPSDDPNNVGMVPPSNELV